MTIDFNYITSLASSSLSTSGTTNFSPFFSDIGFVMIVIMTNIYHPNNLKRKMLIDLHLSISLKLLNAAAMRLRMWNAMRWSQQCCQCRSTKNSSLFRNWQQWSLCRLRLISFILLMIMDIICGCSSRGLIKISVLATFRYTF